MIEDFNGFVGLVVIVAIVFGSIVGFIRLDRSMRKQDEKDEYYRDLL